MDELWEKMTRLNLQIGPDHIFYEGCRQDMKEIANQLYCFVNQTTTMNDEDGPSDQINEIHWDQLPVSNQLDFYIESTQGYLQYVDFMLKYGYGILEMELERRFEGGSWKSTWLNRPYLEEVLDQYLYTLELYGNYSGSGSIGENSVASFSSNGSTSMSISD